MNGNKILLTGMTKAIIETGAVFVSGSDKEINFIKTENNEWTESKILLAKEAFLKTFGLKLTIL
jgi:hypothetical protein